jgi:hypothetical protein
MIRMLIIGYCYGIRFERRLCEEVELHLAYRWFCRLDLEDKVPDHSTFSVNRHGRFQRRSSNNRATSARRSRCDLRTSKPITASSGCGYVASPGRAMSSTSPPSCRTSKRSPANSGSRLPTRWQQAPCERQSHQASDGGQKRPPNREDRRIKDTDRDPHAPHPLLYQRHRPISDIRPPS